MLTVLATGAAVVTIAAVHPSAGTAAQAQASPASTAPVVRQTLVERLAMTGTVGYGPTTSLSNHVVGTYTALPKVGDLISNGQQIYRADDQPVVDLKGAVPAYRPMSEHMTGPDIAQLNAALRTLGFLDGDPGNEFTWQTKWAVKAWQKSLGLQQTGTVDFGRVIFTPAPIRVAKLTPSLGDAATPGTPVLDASAALPQITLSTSATNRPQLRVGDRVTITYPDQSTAEGRISAIGAIQAGNGSDAQPTVSAQVSVRDPKRAAQFQGSVVDVDLNTTQHPNVLTVPVTALLALREGGYAVAVDGPSGRSLVAVQVGIDVNDTVEVSGPGLSAGMKVEVPSQ